MIPSGAKADLVGSLQSKTTLKDKYILVQFDEDDEVYNSKNQKYLYPGLYRNDKTLNPVWMFNATLTHEQLELSKNLKYLTAVNGYALLWDKIEQLEQYAVKFYKNGELKKLYKIADLIEPSDVELVSMGSFYWKEHFGYKGNYLWIKVVSDEVFYFDKRTGKEVTKREYDNNLQPLNIAVILIIELSVFFLALMMFEQKREVSE